MQGYLFKGSLPVEMLPEAVEVGGSWEGHPQTDPPMAHDDNLIEMVYNHLKGIAHPVLIDVGANTGSFSLLPALLPELTVYALEPNQTVFALLLEHIRMNGLAGRVMPFCEAAWHQRDVLTLSIPLPTATGCGTLGAPNGQTPTSTQQVNASPLDDLLSNGIPHVDFIKMDAEGSELYVLQGAAQLIARDHPVLLVECTWTTGLHFGYDRQEILTWIEQAGYSFMWAAEDNAWCEPL